MRIGLLHNTLNIIGGSERYTIDLIDILKEQGNYINLATFDKINWDIVKKMLGYLQYPDNQTYLTSYKPKFLGIYQGILMKMLSNKLRKNSDIIINTHSDHFFCDSDINIIHGVPDNPFIKYGGSVFKKLYFKPYNFLQKNYLKPGDAVYVANSEYTKKRVENILDINNSKVIYPPVDTEIYESLLSSRKRKNQVITVSRFTEDKNFGYIPEIVALCHKDIKFVVITSSIGIKQEVFDKFIKHCKDLGVQSRISLFIDISFKEKLDLMKNSKVYLSVTKKETFGLSIAESCSAGCFPVIQDGGGQIEVVKGISDSIYNSQEKAVQLIESNIKSWTSIKAFKISGMMKKFSKKEYGDKMNKLILDVYEKNLCQM